MAKLLDKITKTIKKASNLETEKETTSNNSTESNGSWIGEGISPRTGEKTYGGAMQTSNIGTSTNYGSYEDDLSRLTEAKKQAQITQLKQARDKALANLDVQEQSIKPTYQKARNQASATSQSGARSFAEYLANRGLTNSGASAQGEINRLSAYQNTLGGIDTAEANAYRDIANQRTAIQNDYVAGVANANNAIAQEYYNNLLNYNQQQRAMVNQLNQQSLGQYADNYQAQIDNLLAQGYSPNSLEVLQLQALRGQKMNNNYNNAMNNAMANIQAGNINYNNASAVGMTVPQAQQYYNNLVVQQQAQAQAEAEALAYERAQQEITNQQKWAQINNDIRNTNSLIASRQNSGGSSKQSISKSYATDLLANDGYFSNSDTSPSPMEGLTNAQYNLAVGIYDLTQQGLSESDAKSILAENGFTSTQINQLFS